MDRVGFESTTSANFIGSALYFPKQSSLWKEKKYSSCFMTLVSSVGTVSLCQLSEDNNISDDATAAEIAI